MLCVPVGTGHLKVAHRHDPPPPSPLPLAATLNWLSSGWSLSAQLCSIPRNLTSSCSISPSTPKASPQAPSTTKMPEGKCRVAYAHDMSRREYIVFVCTDLPRVVANSSGTTGEIRSSMNRACGAYSEHTYPTPRSNPAVVEYVLSISEQGPLGTGSPFVDGTFLDDSQVPAS